MPTLVCFNMINSKSPQLNAGILVGETNITGWDGNVLIDGQINDPDVKPALTAQA